MDLEEYFQVSNFEGVIPRGDWERLPSRLEASTRRLLDLFDETGRRATFFVLGWIARRQPGLLAEIARRGHEIACHGDVHARVTELGPERFRRDLRDARAAIADAVGAAPRGHRAASFSITPRSAWALPALAEAGFAYDSSVFPVRHPRYGWPGFEPTPVRLRLPQGGVLREFPPSTLGAGPLRLPVAGGAYLRFLPGPVFRRGFRRALRRAGSAMLYVHPWEMDADQPRQRVGLRVRVNHYFGLGRTEARLRRLLGEIDFGPVGEVLAALEREGRVPERRLEAFLPAAGPPVPVAPYAAGDAP